MRLNKRLLLVNLKVWKELFSAEAVL